MGHIAARLDPFRSTAVRQAAPTNFVADLSQEVDQEEEMRYHLPGAVEFRLPAGERNHLLGDGVGLERVLPVEHHAAARALPRRLTLRPIAVHEDVEVLRHLSSQIPELGVPVAAHIPDEPLHSHHRSFRAVLTQLAT